MIILRKFLVQYLLLIEEIALIALARFDFVMYRPNGAGAFSFNPVARPWARLPSLPQSSRLPISFGPTLGAAETASELYSNC